MINGGEGLKSQMEGVRARERNGAAEDWRGDGERKQDDESCSEVREREKET